MAIAIGHAFAGAAYGAVSWWRWGYACNLLGGAGGPLAVLFVAIIAAECGKAISRRRRWTSW